MRNWQVFSKILILDNYKILYFIRILTNSSYKLELVYLPKGKYCVYPWMAYRLAIVIPPPPHFGWPKINFWSHFSPFQINTQLLLFLFCSQNGCRRPFWITENHFRTHFWPFQINMQLLFFWFCSQNGCRRSFWMTENHFWSHFSPFQINTQLFLWFFFKIDTSGHFGSSICAKNYRVMNGYAKYEVDRWIYDTVRRHKLLRIWIW